MPSNTALRQSLIKHIYDNNTNWCYANASVQALFWLLLSHDSFEMSEWGPNTSTFLALLTDPAKHISLENHPWFSQLFHTWQTGDRQQDAAEFTTYLMTHMSVDRLRLHWEKKCETELGIQIMDHCNDFQPIVLQFPPVTALRQHFRLQELIDAWHHEHGMIKALTQDQDIICIQIDRLHKRPDGSLSKHLHTVGFWPGCFVPHFTEGSMQVANSCYTVIAVVAHFGFQSTGHYRCMLRCQFDVNADSRMAQWLLVDDNKPKSIEWTHQEWFAANVTLIWLCKHTRTDLYPDIWKMSQHCQTRATENQDYLALFGQRRD